MHAGDATPASPHALVALCTMVWFVLERDPERGRAATSR